MQIRKVQVRFQRYFVTCRWQVLAVSLVGGLFLSACRTQNHAESEINATSMNDGMTERMPLFELSEWQRHPGPPQLEPFFLQDQIYKALVEIPKLPSGEIKVPGVITFHDARGNLVSSNKATFKKRGFTSRSFPKKQYSISLVDDAGNDKNEPLLGMPAAEDWVLSAPYNDKSLLRDITAYNLANKLGRHAPRTRIIDLTMKIGETNDWAGIYVLTEKNTIGPGRIEIPKKNSQGTAFQATFDHTHEGDNVPWHGRGTDLILEYPSASKITPEQQSEFMAVFNDVEDRLTAASGPAWQTIFDDRLDLASAVDFFIIEELARNPDGFRLSSGIYMPPKGKIFFGPVWDFNIAFGNDKDENGVQYDGWRSQEKGIWFQVLWKHPLFCESVRTRWTTARAEGLLSNDTIFHIIDSHAAIMAEIAEANFTRWPSLGRELWPNPYWLKTWAGEKDALKSWISLRTQWLDRALAQLDCKAI